MTMSDMIIHPFLDDSHMSFILIIYIIKNKKSMGAFAPIHITQIFVSEGGEQDTLQDHQGISGIQPVYYTRHCILTHRGKSDHIAAYFHTDT